MGSEKHETSSDEETSRSLSPNSSKEGLGRSYECTFCKRGFTNAQALGGHMNIHRKDKAKAKKHKPNKDHSVSSKSFNHIPNEELQANSHNLGSASLGFHGYQFIPSNPNNFQWALAAKQFDDDNRALHDQEQLRVNLNLGIGTSEMENNIHVESTNSLGHEDWIENDVDLELRLGHYP